MIKIKLLEPQIHRNETTFRPFLYAYNQLKEIGIKTDIKKKNQFLDFKFILTSERSTNFSS